MNRQELIRDLERTEPAADCKRYLSTDRLAGAKLGDLVLGGAHFGAGVVFGAPQPPPGGRRVDMKDVDLEGAQLTDCEFRNADLTKVNLHGARLTRCQFRHVTMKGAELRKCRMRECELSDVSLLEASLDDADLAGDKHRGFANGTSFERVDLGLHQGPDRPRPATVSGLTVRGDRFVQCNFNYVLFDDADLRLCRLERCDFRYAQFRNATLQDTHMTWCDLYRSFFHSGTVLAPRRLDGISLTRAWVAGIVDLTSSAFRESGPAALIQEQHPNTYRAFLERTEEERPDDPSQALEVALIEAALVYRRLAGVWQSQGAYADAAWAYVHSRRLERRHESPWRRRPRPAPKPGSPAVQLPVKEEEQWSDAHRRRVKAEQWLEDRRRSEPGARIARTLRWAVLMGAGALCAFGESLYRVLLWFAVLAAGPGLVYTIFGGVKEKSDGQTLVHRAGHEMIVQSYHATRALGSCLLFSVAELANSSPDRLRAATMPVEVVDVAQTFLGIALLGLLGFVLGNKLRNS